MASRAWLPLATRPSSQRTDTAVTVRSIAFGPGPFEQPDAPAQQLVLQGGGHLGVLAAAAPAGG